MTEYLIRLGARQFSGNLPFTENQDASREIEHFQQLARDQDHGVAVGRELIDQGVDLGLRADVHAACGLVEDEDARPGGQPFCDHQLLLIAA